MLGFLIGTACLIGLIKVARGHRHGSCGGYGYGGQWGEGGGGWGGGPWGRHEGHRGGPRGWGRGGFGPRFFLRGLFERLDTTPGQEKVILAAAEELHAALHKAKDELRGTRADFAQVIRGEAVDEASVADIFMKHDTVISETRRGVVESVRKIHEALTDEQRKQVADLVESGPRFGGGRWRPRGGGPYRQWA
jgi:hypothetical protein